MKFRLKFFLFLIFFTNTYAQVVITPTVKSDFIPQFSDEMNFSLMNKAIERQLEYFERTSLTGQIKFGEDLYPRDVLKKTLTNFQELIKQYKTCFDLILSFEHFYLNAKKYCTQELNQSIQEKFLVYEPKADELRREDTQGVGKTLFTSYYSPDLEGSLVKTEIYKNPVYALPKEEHLRTLSRSQIDFEKKLTGKGYELFYVKESLFDLYLLHVEGGGRIKIKQADGTFKQYYLSYAGANGSKFEFIYKYMLEKGMITQERRSLEDQRKYLRDHPEQQAEVYSSNPSYIFFKITDEEPLGVGNIPLTANRSMAIDTRLYSTVGMLHFIDSKRPVLNGNEEVILKNFKRFFISQDTGGAIRGAARVDLYMGYGRQAEIAAHNMKYYGHQYILVLKE